MRTIRLLRAFWWYWLRQSPNPAIHRTDARTAWNLAQIEVPK